MQSIAWARDGASISYKKTHVYQFYTVSQKTHQLWNKQYNAKL